MSNPLKYLHFNKKGQKDLSKALRPRFQSRTVAVLSLSGHAIMQLASNMMAPQAPDTNHYVRMMVGVTYVSTKDQYSREIGRNESTKKMKEVNLKVTGVEINDTHIFVRLEEHQGVRMTLRLNKSTGFSTVTGFMI